MDRTDNYYNFIYAVSEKNIEDVKRLLPLIDPKENESQGLRIAARGWDIELVKLLLPLSDPKASDSEALYEAVCYVRIDIVKLLLPLSEPSAAQNRALRAAAIRGKMEIAELLLPVSDLTIDNTAVLRWCVEKNHVPNVQFLIDAGQEDDDFGSALGMAASYGFTDMMRLLLPKKTKEQINQALFFGIDNNQIPTVDFLYSLCDVDVVLQKFGPDYPATDALLYLRKIAEAKMTKVFLKENIQGDHKLPAPGKKM